MAEPLQPLRTKRTRLVRKRDRGSHDLAALCAVMDEGLVCHVGFVQEGQPYVLPTIYARDGERLLIHGSRSSRMLRALAAGAPACISVTLLDGLVLARSARMHSVNYRSVMLLGQASEITDDAEKISALKCIVERVMPGRWDDVRLPSPTELHETGVLAFPICEGSLKSRVGPPMDRREDLSLRVWAGEVPLRIVAAEPRADSGGERMAQPEYLERYLANSR